MQAQDPRGARLAVRARSRGLTAGDVDRALGDRMLVVDWLNRGTLHLVRGEDHAWLHALTTPPQVNGNLRRLAQEGLSGAAVEKGVRTVVRALEDGPATRPALRNALDRAGVPTKGQALVHVLMRASLLGLVVRGPMDGREQAFALVADWLGEPPAIERDAALRELGRRYLAGHAPAGDRDLAKWAGIGLRDARAALAGQERAVSARTPALPPPKLLGAYDPVLHGWVDRTPVVGRHARVVTDNGLFRPIALVEGRAVATWALPGGKVELRPFGRLARDVRAALAAEATDVERFLAGS